jgi:hypothetical protein
VAEVILAADPDVLALVETSGHNSERLETALGLDCAQVDYLQTGKAGPYGVAVCTRGEDWVLKNARARRFESERDWAYMFSEIQHTSPGRSDQIFNLLAVHLRAFPHPENPLADLAQLDATSEQVARDQSEQAHELLQRVKQFRDPTLVAGDFNNTRDAALHVELRRSLLDTWETAGQGPGGTRPIGHLLDLELPEWARIVPRVDYIYATPTFWAEQAWVPEVDCTDHRPVVADLVLETPR